jgi:hypothetical protein
MIDFAVAAVEMLGHAVGAIDGVLARLRHVP